MSSSGIIRRRTNNVSSREKTVLPTHHADPIISRKASRTEERCCKFLYPTKRCLAAIVFSASCIALICWMWLKVGPSLLAPRSPSLPSKVEEKHQRGLLARSPSLLRISSSDYANVTQFFPCVNDVFIPPHKSDVDLVLRAGRKKDRSPKFDSLPCTPPNKNACFRGVYDGFDAFLDVAHNGSMSSLFKNIAVLLESLILDPGTPISPALQLQLEQRTPTLIEPSLNRERNYTATDAASARNFGDLHCDYYESALYVYTAILYDDPPEDLLGGETALVDLRKDSVNKKITFGMKIKENITMKALDRSLESDKVFKDNLHTNEKTIDFTSGMIVEPKRGRLVLFTAGGENFHAPMPVTRGTRPCYHFWFKCKSG